MPGAITPPTYSPRAETASKVVAVPKSTTIAGPPYSSTAATALMIRSAPTSLGLSVRIGTPRLHARLDQNGGDVAVVPPGDLAQLVQHGRHGRADRDAVDAVAQLLAEQRVHAHEALEQHRQLVGRAARVRGDAPVLDDVLAVEQAEDGVRVADVDREQHGRYSASRRSRPMSRIGEGAVRAPTARKSTPVSAYRARW